MPPPVRTVVGDYHYHVYDYNGSGPWNPQAVGTSGLFYSMFQDLTALAAFATGLGIPNVALQTPGQAIAADGNTFRTLALEFGGSAGNEPTVVFTGGIHAGEWIAPEIAYLIAEYLIMHYESGPYKSPYSQKISEIVNARRIKVVPSLNPAGNWWTVFGADPNSREWRKNRRLLPSVEQGNNYIDWLDLLSDGPSSSPQTQPNPPFRNIKNLGSNRLSYETDIIDVQGHRTPDTIDIDFTKQIIGVDANRNFNTPNWGCESAAQDEGLPTSSSYFGPSRLSEAESKNLDALLANQTIQCSIDFHSYSKLILYTSEGVVGPQEINMGLALQRLISSSNKKISSYDYKLGTAIELLKYNAYSTVADYMSHTHNSCAFTIELDPSEADPGFRLPADQIMGVFEKNIRAALGFLAGAGQNIVVKPGGKILRHDIQNPTVSQFLNWDVFGRGNQLPLATTILIKREEYE